MAITCIYDGGIFDGHSVEMPADWIPLDSLTAKDFKTINAYSLVPREPAKQRQDVYRLRCFGGTIAEYEYVRTEEV